jgi:hypothetical protein
MRPLPEEIVHDPIEAGPHRMAMGLTVVPDSDWFELDTLYPSEMAEKRRLLLEQYEDVFATAPGSEAACAEALTMVASHLTEHYPDWFSATASVVSNGLTGETWNRHQIDPLELAGRLVQEDLCIVQTMSESPVFTAGVLCFPSRWRLSEKIGRPLADVHGPVPLYADRLAAPVNRFMRHLKPGRIVSRLNWSVVDDAALFQPGGKWRTVRNEAITAENAGEKLFFRVERQTLRVLPETGAILFGIRVHVHPLWRVASARLAAAVRALPDDIAHYKSLPSFRTALLACLDNTP